jgi:hypothetical protein
MKNFKLKHKILDALNFMKRIDEDVFLCCHNLSLEQLHKISQINLKQLIGILDSLENSGDIQRFQNDTLILITKKGMANLSDSFYLYEHFKFKSEKMNFRFNIIKTLSAIFSILLFVLCKY